MANKVVNTMKQRLDQWLWHARFFKSRSLAAVLCQKKQILVDGEKIKKPSQLIISGQTLKFKKAQEDFIVKVVSLAQRRGPALEAQDLYEDLRPPPELGKGIDPIKKAMTQSPAMREGGGWSPDQTRATENRQIKRCF